MCRDVVTVYRGRGQDLTPEATTELGIVSEVELHHLYDRHVSGVSTGQVDHPHPASAESPDESEAT